MASSDSPSGLNLRPDPPRAMRVSRKIGVIVALLAMGIGILVIYGIFSRDPVQAARHVGDRPLQGASDSGRQVAAQLDHEPALVAPENLPATLAARAGRSGSAPAPQSLGPARVPKVVRYPGQPQVAGADFPGTTSADGNAAIKAAEAAYEAEQKARAASADVSGAWTTSEPAGPLALNLAHGRPGAAPAVPADPKVAFAKIGSAPAGALDAMRQPPTGPYVIQAGWVIPAALEQAVDSDLPGEMRALVRENVYDTQTGAYLLIPQGARLLGEYNSQVTYGQALLQAAWTRLLFPNGSSVDLARMGGDTPGGSGGFSDKVNNHYRRLIGFGALTSLFSAGFALSQSRRGGVLVYPSATEMAGTAVGQQMSELGIEVTRRNLSVQPTIRIRPGYRFIVRVNRDLVFDGPYRPTPSYGSTIRSSEGTHN